VRERRCSLGQGGEEGGKREERREGGRKEGVEGMRKETHLEGLGLHLSY